MANPNSSASSKYSVEMIFDGEQQPPSLNFTHNDSDIVLDEEDKTLYWSTLHNALTLKDLFEWAFNTKKRFLQDLEKIFKELHNSRMQKFLNGGRRLSDPRLDERFELR
ncbi:hypothetical protein HD806DRAFT_537033 [Xylariaceae sp. AK1471]|nr:hypothetical protein HD806DRAFT_537033 [Xylariaceae sp. AK1471]